MFENNQNEIVGILEYHYDFYSRYLKNERDILVWLPHSSQTTSKKYPVLYMHDGQNLFNPSTSFSGFDWKVDETISDLSSKNLAEELIVVGINNTPDRLNEYNFFTDKGKNYSLFIKNELMPFIEERYPVKTGSNNTGIMGSSMGGLCSFQLFWNYPQIFGKAACLSSSFWIDEKKVFEMIKQQGKPKSGFKLYLDCGDEEKELIDDNLEMIKKLKDMGIKNSDELMYHIQKGGTHSEYDWARRLHIPISFLFTNK
ncbi:MAG: esterase family protein [Ignavibacteriae bacterium]|jgi:predicted alpha/beta superfamily hydrolase|nr:esterase family protein [Ignavibacteriota bacterium]NOG96764.1 esterase family protein [Ignavibacteriota bacterium]